MTTIAASRKQIASDLQASLDTHKFKVTNKIYYCQANPNTYETNFHVGYAGSIENCYDVIEWLSYPEDEKPPRSKNSASFLVLTDDGKLFTFNNPRQWIEVDQDYYAIGSGAQFACAAMALGKTPAEAVEVAIGHDVGSGFGVDSYDLE